jgi:hypothetical protein
MLYTVYFGAKNGEGGPQRTSPDRSQPAIQSLLVFSPPAKALVHRVYHRPRLRQRHSIDVRGGAIDRVGGVHISKVR